MARFAADAEVLRDVGLQLGRVGAELGLLSVAVAVSLGRIGLASGDVGVAGAAARAQATWRRALLQGAELTAKVGAGAAVAGEGYRFAEQITAVEFARPAGGTR